MLTSAISWIDFSESDRRKMIEVISLFRERETRDELGLGSIRDTFAELFFPGTSTLQTRARYSLFVPWLYRYFETRRRGQTPYVERLRWDENRLIQALKAAGEEGVIGQRSGASLQRYPSSIYWNGLRRWGILRYAGSQSQYHRWLDSGIRSVSQRTEVNDEPVGGWGGANWDPALPSAPDGFPDTAVFALTEDEARYLRERLQLSCPTSLFTTLVERCDPVDGATFIWEHPQASEFTEEQRQSIRHAQVFSTLMVGATLLYNLMLSELIGAQELFGVYEEALADWREELSPVPHWLTSWDRRAFWRLVHANGHVPAFTVQFVDRWLDGLLTEGRIPDVSSDPTARALVREREIWLKRGRSRFESARHRELWSGSSGTAALDYRWRIAQRLTNDILRGLKA